MGRLFDQIGDVFSKIFQWDMPGLMEVLKQPEITTAAFIALAIIVFTETGLLVGFLLPGDSLLVTVGIVAWTAGWDLHWLILTLWTAAVLGNSSGYLIGAKAGPRLFCRDESFFFRKSHLLKVQSFYEKHGGKTIVIAQFIPILRTFAPVVAGIGRMPYRRFLMFTMGGAVLWIGGLLSVGYVLTPVLDQPLKSVFGPEFETAKHVEKVIILVVLLSISPGIYAGIRGGSQSGARRERHREKCSTRPREAPMRGLMPLISHGLIVVAVIGLVGLMIWAGRQGRPRPAPGSHALLLLQRLVPRLCLPGCVRRFLSDSRCWSTFTGQLARFASTSWVYTSSVPPSPCRWFGKRPGSMCLSPPKGWRAALRGGERGLSRGTTSAKCGSVHSIPGSRSTD